MKDNDNILRELQFLAGLTPNDQDLGKKVRAIVNAPSNNPERSCDIEDEDCISCGS